MPVSIPLSSATDGIPVTGLRPCSPNFPSAQAIIVIIHAFPTFFIAICTTSAVNLLAIATTTKFGVPFIAATSTHAPISFVIAPASCRIHIVFTAPMFAGI